MAFTALHTLLNRAVHRAGIHRGVTAAKAVSRSEEIVKEFFGADILEVIKPLSLRGRILTFACIDSSAAASIGMYEEMIVQYVNEGFDKSVADRITIVTT
ncbi:MAG: DciA family protein [Patescibacteria group bacterium]